MENLPDDTFEKNVFINCPFDKEYFSILRPILFTIIYFGFNPKIASERSDSLESRMTKICELIKRSRYSIHDLSRLKSGKKNEFFRLNMPFELGIEYGCRYFTSDQLSEKKCLILEKEEHDYKVALSDLSGADIKSHFNDPAKAVIAVRNWFYETVGLRKIASGKAIWYKFTDFANEFYSQREKEGKFTDEDLNMMPIPEYIDFIKDWIESNHR